MINKQEIMEHARLFNLSPNTIEKDYVLNWLLAKTIYNRSGIEIPQDKITFEVYENTRSNLSVQGKIAYRSPMGRRSSDPTVKLDLNWDEILVESSVLREIHHPYSDPAFNNIKIMTYSIEEILAEKLRALVQRMSPRDLYDVIHLYKDNRWDPNREKVLAILKKKCQFKNVDMPTLSLVNSLSAKEDLIADWDNMLTNQIADLAPYTHYWDQLADVFDWLYTVTSHAKNH